MNTFVERCSDYRQENVHAVVREWKPLFASTIRPGDAVVLKPNWLAHRHKHRPDEWESVITHPAVITAVLDIVLECLNGSGSVVITDSPQTDSSWREIMNRMQPERWIEAGKRRGVAVSVLDLRDQEWETRGDVNVGRRALPGDPAGSVACDLGSYSEFVGHRPSAHGYYGADYDTRETNDAHAAGHHRYKVSGTVVAADVFINLPKMKTHKKAGITCSLKNLVGINTHKNWLPHHNEGTPDVGGDQFPAASSKNSIERVATERFKNFLVAHPEAGKWLIPAKALGKRLFGDTQHTIRSGNWYGNDTLWRTVLDLNKVLFYANPDGSLRPDAAESRKRYITVVDGIIAGEGNGPEAPDRRASGVLVAGTHPVAVDAVCARFMGFDWQAIPSLRQAFRIAHYRLCDFDYDAISIVSSDQRGPIALSEWAVTGNGFRPHFGWTGRVELRAS